MTVVAAVWLGTSSVAATILVVGAVMSSRVQRHEAERRMMRMTDLRRRQITRLIDRQQVRP